MNVVCGVRWERVDDRRRALLACPAGAPDAVAVPQSSPPTELPGATLHLLRGVSGRRRVEVAPVSRDGGSQ